MFSGYIRGFTRRGIYNSFRSNSINISIQRPTRLPLIQSRSIKLSASQLSAVKGWGFVINIVAGAYIGGLLVCFGLLYFLYLDANDRQNIPFELSFKNQVTTVKAINKDDVLKSPRYAVKHYRRLLIELARAEDPNLEFDESSKQNRFMVPVINASVLVYEKSNDFANFYIDIVLRYAKALLAKGELDTSIYVLKEIIDDDELFYKLGDAERLSQCCRLLSKVCPRNEDKVAYLDRSINMLRSTFTSIVLDKDYLIQDNSRITDELISCLNGLAFTFAKASPSHGKEKELYLLKALNIYLANLKKLSLVQQAITYSEQNQASYPLFNCDLNNIKMLTAEIKAHISEIMWAKGYKKNAISWGEDVVEEIYFVHSSETRASPILINVLRNLIIMYEDIKDVRSIKRCEKLLGELSVFQLNESSWYDNVINRFCKIIYNKGPLGIIEKSLSERFGSPQPILEIEEFEDEDKE